MINIYWVNNTAFIIYALISIMYKKTHGKVYTTCQKISSGYHRLMGLRELG